MRFRVDSFLMNGHVSIVGLGNGRKKSINRFALLIQCFDGCLKKSSRFCDSQAFKPPKPTIALSAQEISKAIFTFITSRVNC